MTIYIIVHCGDRYCGEVVAVFTERDEAMRFLMDHEDRDRCSFNTIECKDIMSIYTPIGHA